MKLHELKPAEGSRRPRKRVGRGTSSGYGKTSGRGQRGQLVRQDGHTRPDFEDGQMSLFRIMPGRGFKNINRKEYVAINLDGLNEPENGNEVTIANLKAKGLVKKELSGIKLLANGGLKVKVTVKVNKASKTTEEAVNAAGGSVEVV